RFLHGDVDFYTGRTLPRPEAFAPYHRHTPPSVPIDEWGRASARHPASGELLLTRKIYYPLWEMERPDELEAYPWPEMTDPARWEGLAEAVSRGKRAGRATVGQMSQTIMEMGYELRSMERLLVDLHENPAFVHRLFQILTRLRCQQARALVEAGVDILRVGDDLGTQQALLISPQTYRTWVKPCHAAVIRAARELRPDLPILYHSDGNIEAIIPDLLEIGVTAINPVQPECLDPVRVKARWGDRLTIWGAVSTQRTLAFGTLQDVEAEVDARLREIAPGGGYVVNFINTVWSPTARRNVFHYLWCIHRRGVYR
ncbi:MAG: uroporphyrinogen decarboxylase family protein, partial [Armatimonadota bacterium]|nr:uroporphyrinogen decarboxylase family protein [Armatimonadota bacterium]